MRYPIVKFQLENELDLVLAYKRAMKIAESCLLGIADQTSFATAVSEICRNTLEYAKEGSIEFSIQKGEQMFLYGEVIDQGKGFTNIEDVLSGKFAQGNSRGKGLLRTKRIVDIFKIESTSTGTKVNIGVKLYPKVAITSSLVDSWVTSFRNEKPISPYEELKKKNVLLFELSEQLKESEEQYRILSEYAPLMVFTLDGEGKTTYINSWTQKYCGYNCEQIGETGWRDIIHPDDYLPFLKSWETNIAEGAATEMEYRLKEITSAEYRWHQFRLIPYKDEDGVISKWIGFNIDIHAHKMLEETLRDNTALKEVQENLETKVFELNLSNAELEKFAYVASHDLQEPLRKITLFGEKLIQTSEMKETDKEILSRMQNSAVRMRQLIQGLLAFSLLGKKKKFEKLSLNEIIVDVVHDLEFSVESKHAEVNIELDLPMVYGDAMQLRQLFQNLISNSLKYGNVEKPVISVFCVSRDSKNFTISVKDNGIGFNELYLGKIFEIFQRLHLDGDYDGTGIGLAICKKIVINHKGKITAKSREGEGSDFLIEFPVCK